MSSTLSPDPDSQKMHEKFQALVREILVLLYKSSCTHAMLYIWQVVPGYFDPKGYPVFTQINQLIPANRQVVPT